MRKEPAKKADEYDALSRRWKNWLIWKPGERKAIKTRVNRRERHTTKQKLQGGKFDE